MTEPRIPKVDTISTETLHAVCKALQNHEVVSFVRDTVQAGYSDVFASIKKQL